MTKDEINATLKSWPGTKAGTGSIDTIIKNWPGPEATEATLDAFTSNSAFIWWRALMQLGLVTREGRLTAAGQTLKDGGGIQ